MELWNKQKQEGRPQALTVQRKLLRQWLRRGLCLGLGALFAAARTAEGIRPLGVAYCAAAGHPAEAALGAFLYYVLLGGSSGLIYGAACAVVLTCRLVLEGTAMGRTRWFFPVCAMISVCSTGLVLVDSLRQGAALLCQTLLCGGFARMLREAREGPSPMTGWGRLTALLAGILALLPLAPGGLVLSRVAAAGVVLTCACCCGAASGALLGAAYGAAVDLSLGQSPFFALLWCVSALGAGALSRRERLQAALSFSILCGVLCLWLYQQPGAGAAFYESLLAGAALVLTPKKLWLQAEAAFAALLPETGLRRRHGEADRALQGLSSAVLQLGQAMDGLLHGAAADPGDLSRVFRSACEVSCRSCKRCAQCWQQDYETMRNLLCDLAEPLRQKHALAAADLPAWFSGSCLRPERFCGSVNDAYREALRREARLQQEQELRTVMGRQYESLGALLEVAAARAGAGTELDPQLEHRIRGIVRTYLPGARVAVSLTGGRLQIELLVKEAGPETLAECETLRRSLQSALSVTLLPPEPVESAKGAAVRLRQQEKCALQVCSAVRKKAGESVCGDDHRRLHTEDGRAAVLLSDGMGTGQQAGLISRQALDLLCSFVRSGCSLSESVAAVLPVLAARFTEWGFVTLDLFEVNLFSGRCGLLKYGAAPSFLLREGRLTRFDSRALPAGLAAEEPAEPLQLRLSPGDRLILLSDGAFLENATEALLREQGALEGQALAQLLLETAAKQGANDDMTVLVADLQLAETA